MVVIAIGGGMQEFPYWYIYSGKIAWQYAKCALDRSVTDI
jgi:hypothetical protein